MEYELREDGVQCRRLSWLQASESSSKLLRSKVFRDTVTLRCWNLPYVGQLLVDQPGGLAISSGHRLIWWGDAMSVCNEPNASQDHTA